MSQLIKFIIVKYKKKVNIIHIKSLKTYFERSVNDLP